MEVEEYVLIIKKRCLFTVYKVKSNKNSLIKRNNEKIESFNNVADALICAYRNSRKSNTIRILRL